MSVPHAKRAVVVASPFRLTERNSTSPGVLAIADSIGSATNREISSAAASLLIVRIVMTGKPTSGNNETGNRVSDTEPNNTTPRIEATVVTGRLTAKEAMDTLLTAAVCEPAR